MEIGKGKFEWDDSKDALNQMKHGVSFAMAQLVFDDPFRVIAFDERHSVEEPRWFCIGKAGEHILTVRFTIRDGVIRIIGAGQWRKGKKYYDRNDKLH
jgi:uncharacterized DUF497 family protein